MLLQYLLLRARLFFKRTDGASAIEYTVIIAMVSLVVITFISPLGSRVKVTFNSVLVALGGAAI